MSKSNRLFIVRPSTGERILLAKHHPILGWYCYHYFGISDMLENFLGAEMHDGKKFSLEFSFEENPPLPSVEAPCLSWADNIESETIAKARQLGVIAAKNACRKIQVFKHRGKKEVI